MKMLKQPTSPVFSSNAIVTFSACAICLALGTSMVLALGEPALMRNFEIQTMLIRRKATEEQLKIAEANKLIAFKELTPVKKAELKKKNVRVVLIKTKPDSKAPKGHDTRMRYSLEGEVLIDDYTYEFPSPLQPGSFARTT